MGITDLAPKTAVGSVKLGGSRSGDYRPSHENRCTEDRMSISFFRIIDESKFYIFLWRDTTSLGTQVFDCCYTRSEN